MYSNANAVYLIHLNRKAPASRHINFLVIYILVISKYYFLIFTDCDWYSVVYSAFYFLSFFFFVSRTTMLTRIPLHNNLCLPFLK